MLTIKIPGTEIYNENINEFSVTKELNLVLEHSLVSLAKWESRWCIPFLSDKDKTTVQILDYIRCMTITQNINPEVYLTITNDVINQINEYIDYPMTATTFSKNKQIFGKQIITAEIIYYWMITFGIPFECQKWHLNRLLTLINVCNIKNQPPKKMSKNEIFSRQHSLNQARRQQLNSRG